MRTLKNRKYRIATLISAYKLEKLLKKNSSGSVYKKCIGVLYNRSLGRERENYYHFLI